jgi:hypothetical protein
MERPKHRRLHTLLLPVLLSTSILLSALVALGTEAVSTTDDSQGKVTKKVEAEKPASSPLKDWLTFVGSVSAALIAGLFAVYQLRRSTAAQRALEHEKLVTARTEAELAQVRSATREYQQAQALPFLEQLDKTLYESYKTAHFPPYFPDLGGCVPQLRRFADRAMRGWLVATEDMSRHRMRLLLVLSQDRIEIVTSLLSQFMDLMRQILDFRNQVWFRQASQHDLWEIQRSYVRVGYRLMMEIREAVSSVPKEQTLSSGSAKESLAEALTMPFEKASAVSIPYGSHGDFCWVAIWEIATSPDWRRYLESMTHTSHEEFEEKLKELAVELYRQGSFLDVKLSKVISGELEIFCLAVSLASATRLMHFLDSELETYRQTNAILWSSYRSPLEIVIGLDDTKAKTQRPEPTNALQPTTNSGG